MASPALPDLKGTILATATKDEDGNDWRAVIYSRDAEGRDLYYIGAREMPQYNAVQEQIKQLGSQIDELRTHYTHMGQPIRWSSETEGKRKLESDG